MEPISRLRLTQYLRIALTMWLALCAVSAVSSAQTTHQVVLNWTASADAAANPSLTYNVYRLNNACVTPVGTNYVKVNTAAITTATFTDTTVTVGVYCYYVTAVLNGAESVPSNTAQATVLPKAPTAVTVTSVQ